MMGVSFGKETVFLVGSKENHEGNHTSFFFGGGSPEKDTPKWV